MHSVRGRRCHVVAVVSGLACCLVAGVEAGSGATAWSQTRTGPTADEVAEARSEAVERSKQLNDATARLDEARRRLEELVALERAGGPTPAPSAVPDAPDGPAAPDASAGTSVRPDLETDEDEILAQARNVGLDGESGSTVSGFGPDVIGQAAEVRRFSLERARLRTEAETALTTAQRLVAEREAARKRRRAARGRSRARAAAQEAQKAQTTQPVQAVQPVQTTQVAVLTEQTRGNIAADWALTQIDKPYVWASAGPSGYDCSGLTMQAWARVGVKMDHWTGTQWTAGRHVPYDQLQRGDLLFFGRGTRRPADIRHVGIYIGNGMMVHAPQTGDVVRVAPMWRKDLIGATRPA
ncbi:NlpC/P60 family protein [Streptosporangium sp. NPDC001559]|uniref:NlpC/P60 family protein n=1 Tax=Streptosporangium sp. NPDC001559 TaxID=3366187 RepID=UPI0036EA9238